MHDASRSFATGSNAAGPNPAAVGAPGLDALCRALTAVLGPGSERDLTGRGKRVADLLRDYAASGQCWRNWAHFVPERYSRNLVHRSETFELLLLCWGVGHASPIHDHAGQQCWMAILDGELEEVHYDEPRDGASRPMASGRVRRFTAPGVAYIHDDIALHLIRPVPGTRGVSLHLYADPIDACRAFDPATGRATPVEVGYHSVRGVPCDGRSAAEIRKEWVTA